MKTLVYLYRHKYSYADVISMCGKILNWLLIGPIQLFGWLIMKNFVIQLQIENRIISEWKNTMYHDFFIVVVRVGKNSILGWVIMKIRYSWPRKCSSTIIWYYFDFSRNIVKYILQHLFHHLKLTFDLSFPYLYCKLSEIIISINRIKLFQCSI